jgi:hypothetical protein
MDSTPDTGTEPVGIDTSSESASPAPASITSTATTGFGASQDDIRRGCESLNAISRAWDEQSTERAIAETWRVLRLGTGWVELAAFDCGDISEGEDGPRWSRLRGHAVRYVRSAEEAVTAATPPAPLGQRGYYLVPATLTAGREAVYDANVWSVASDGTAKESDVIRSAVLCVDCDPKRPSNTSATRLQWAAAVGVAGFVRETLLGTGVPASALGLGHSGNGAHVHIYTDVVWSGGVKTLRERILRALGVLCHYVRGPNTRVSIDQTLADGARYIPLYGTMKRKGGKGHPDRPWRKTALIGPDVVTPLDIDGLRRIADALEGKLTNEAIEFWEAEWKSSPRKAPTGASAAERLHETATRGTSNFFDLVKKLDMREVVAYLGIDLSTCPGCGNVKGAGITKHPTDGIDLVHCFHETCAERDNWTNIRLILQAKGVAEGDKRATFDAIAEVARHFGIDVPKRRNAKAARPSKEERAKALKAVMSAIDFDGQEPKTEPPAAESNEIPQAEPATAQAPSEAKQAEPAAASASGGEAPKATPPSTNKAEGKGPSSSPPTGNGVDYDTLLRPALGLDAIQQEQVIEAIANKYGIGKTVLRKRLAQLAAEQAAEDGSEASEQDALSEVLSAITLVQATNCRVFARVNGEVIPADSPKLKAKIAYLYNRATGARIGATTIETALAPMIGADVPRGVVPVRSAYAKDGSIWIDLGGDQRGFVHVTKMGVSIKEACPVAFYRPGMMAPMPTPVFPKDDAECKAILEEAQAHFQIDRQQLASAFAWAIGALRPGEPCDGGKVTEYFVILVVGPQGSGKTTFADAWSQTIDPKVTPHLKLPRDDEALAILAENGRSLVFNNLSYIPEWASNALCELADGNGMVLRSLYTNRDTTVFMGSNAVALVSIGDVAVTPDLLDRSLTITLPERTVYVEPEQVEAAFQALRPRLLGALLYCASRALRDSDRTRAPKGVRMAGAARWALAGAPAAGFTRDEIEAAFTSAIMEADEQVGDRPVVRALCSVVAPGATWTGTTEELLDALAAAHEARIPETGGATKKLPKDWPQKARGLASELRKAAKTLTRSGFTFDWPKKGGRAGRILTVTRQAQPDADVAAAPPSAVETPSGTISGTVGTISPESGVDRSIEKNQGGNDRNDWNDLFLLLEEEKNTRVVGERERGQGHVLVRDTVEDVQDTVPIVPIVPTSEKQAGTIDPRGSVRSFPDRPASPPDLPPGVLSAPLLARAVGAGVEPSVFARPDSVYPQDWQLVVEVDTEAGRAVFVQPLHPIFTDRTLEQLTLFGGERQADGSYVLRPVALVVRVRRRFIIGFGDVLEVATADVVRQDVA